MDEQLKFDTMKPGSKFQVVRLRDFGVFLKACSKLNQAYPGQRLTQRIDNVEHTILLTSPEETLYFKLFINSLLNER